MQEEFQQAMQHRRAVSRDEQEMHALVDFEQEAAPSAQFMDTDLDFGIGDVLTSTMH